MCYKAFSFITSCEKRIFLFRRSIISGLELRQLTMLTYMCVLTVAMVSLVSSRDHPSYVISCNSNDTCTEKILKYHQEYSNSAIKCPNKHQKMRLSISSENRTMCDNVTINCTFSCAGTQEVVEFRTKNEACNLEKAGISLAKSSSDIMNSSSSTFTFNEREITVKIDSVDNTTLFVATLVTSLYDIENASVAKDFLKNSKANYFIPGAHAPAVIVNVQNENFSESRPYKVDLTFEQPMQIRHFDSHARIRNMTPVCAYFKEPEWDSSVCNTTSDNKNMIDCSCYHNSAFAVIFAVEVVNIGSIIVSISTAFEIASMAALFITVILLIKYRRNMRIFDRVLVQISLCIALFMTHLFLLLSPLVVASEGLCTTVVILGHYFLMVSAVLMVMEGALLLIKVLFPNFLGAGSSNPKFRRIMGFLIGWIIPLIYVGMCATIGILGNQYLPRKIEGADRYEVCWISHEFNWVVIVPIAVAVGINLVIAIRLGVLVATMSKKAEEFKPSNERDISSFSHARKAIRAIVILLPILGIPWSLGFLINVGHIPTATAFASIHAVVNGCQGLFLFMHYIVFNSEMRATIARSWKTAVSDFGSFSPPVHFVSTTNTSVQSNTTNRTESLTVLKAD